MKLQTPTMDGHSWSWYICGPLQGYQSVGKTDSLLLAKCQLCHDRTHSKDKVPAMPTTVQSSWELTCTPQELFETTCIAHNFMKVQCLLYRRLPSAPYTLHPTHGNPRGWPNTMQEHAVEMLFCQFNFTLTPFFNEGCSWNRKQGAWLVVFWFSYDFYLQKDSTNEPLDCVKQPVNQQQPTTLLCFCKRAWQQWRYWNANDVVEKLHHYWIHYKIALKKQTNNSN